MQRLNDLGQGVHSGSASGDVDFGDIVQVAAVSIIFTTSYRILSVSQRSKTVVTWCLSRSFIDAVHQRSCFPTEAPCCFEFGEPVWLQKVLVCFCRPSEQ